MPRTQARRRIALVIGSVTAAWWALGLLTVIVATAPVNAPIPPRTQLHGRPVEDVTTTTADGVAVRGWLVRATATEIGCVVLAPGVRGNRLAMIDRAAWHLDHGWSVLLVDLRGNGASAPARITMGFAEARDLVAWHAFLRSRGFARVGVHGVSLGAAAIAFAGDTPWDFAVLESCYRDLDAALAARLPWVPLPTIAFWPVRRWADWLLALPWHRLRPVDAIASLRCPTLLLCGADDEKVGPDALAALLAACAAERKRAVPIPGAVHEDLWLRDRDRCAAALADFLR